MPRRAARGGESLGGEKDTIPVIQYSTQSIWLARRERFVKPPVSRTFGKMDMYRNFANAPNQHYIEQMLSRLESDAAKTIEKIRNAYEAGKQDIWISHSEKDTLRKFQFIMKYRGSREHQRFHRQNAEGYSEKDKEVLTKYMCEKGFKRPVDVWFDNIKALLEMEIHPEGRWAAKLLERIYPQDAQWVIAHMQIMYLALCTPSSPQDEFLLTENAYAIHEGPVSLVTDTKTGKTREPYTEYHVFTVISPKLIMVLRSFLLRVPEEETANGIRELRQTMYERNTSRHADRLRANSCLEDLPISKARNSYTKMVNGRLVLADGEDGTLRSGDKFCFRFFLISTNHVNTINSIMLEESYAISTIVFKSKVSARRALEFYLIYQCHRKVGFMR